MPRKYLRLLVRKGMFQLCIICEKEIIYHMFFTNVLRENQHFRYCRDKVVKCTFLAGFIVVIPIYLIAFV